MAFSESEKQTHSELFFLDEWNGFLEVKKHGANGQQSSQPNQQTTPIAG
jgi:hypothetical protein